MGPFRPRGDPAFQVAASIENGSDCHRFDGAGYSFVARSDLDELGAATGIVDEHLDTIGVQVVCRNRLSLAVGQTGPIRQRQPHRFRRPEADIGNFMGTRCADGGFGQGRDVLVAVLADDG